MSFLHLLFLGFSCLSLSIAILFFTKNIGDKVANRLIGFLLFLFSYFILYSVLYWSNLITKFPHIKGTIYIPISLFGTIFYLYMRRVLGYKKMKILDLIHLIPFLFTFLSFSKFYFQSALNKKNIILNNSFNDYILLVDYVDILMAVIILFYAIKSFLLYKKINPVDEDIKIWVKAIGLSFLGLSASFIVYSLLIYSELLSPSQDYFISLMMVFFISIVSYFAFMQPDVFNGKPIEQVIPLPFIKYKKTGLSKGLSNELKFKLIDYMENDKIYIESNLSLNDIANLLNISRNQASQIINENFDKSFYDFVNSYRIIEAKKMLNNHEGLNFNKIAYSVGFNNRVSFYKSFKKFTGLNPTQYTVKKGIRQ